MWNSRQISSWPIETKISASEKTKKKKKKKLTGLSIESPILHDCINQPQIFSEETQKPLKLGLDFLESTFFQDSSIYKASSFVKLDI